MHKLVSLTLVLLTYSCIIPEKEVVPENIINLQNGFWHQVSPNLDPDNPNWRIHEFEKYYNHTEYVFMDRGLFGSCWDSAYNLTYSINDDTLFHGSHAKFIFMIEEDSLFTFNKLLNGTFSKQPVKYRRMSTLGYPNCN